MAECLYRSRPNGSATFLLQFVYGSMQHGQSTHLHHSQQRKVITGRKVDAAEQNFNGNFRKCDQSYFRRSGIWYGEQIRMQKRDKDGLQGFIIELDQNGRRWSVHEYCSWASGRADFRQCNCIKCFVELLQFNSTYFSKRV
ncbi:Hypothetical_protein [Hexamita inflata]|uniref:Hypothetical_protein n=1 Tax=Hexamita inflata TaxID=28002 RepID=A0AA86UY46_9EUKA|nr:Hypothetical protein HINF_LOCUS56836 [Hexamita inflata]